MSGKRSKWLRKLIEKFDVNLLLSLRKIYGEKTNKMEIQELYKKSKKIWIMKIKETKTWGKPKSVI